MTMSGAEPAQNDRTLDEDRETATLDHDVSGCVEEPGGRDFYVENWLSALVVEWTKIPRRERASWGRCVICEAYTLKKVGGASLMWY